MEQTTKIIYTWPDGREEVRYAYPKDSEMAVELIKQVSELQLRDGGKSPYSFRHVPSNVELSRRPAVNKETKK